MPVTDHTVLFRLTPASGQSVVVSRPTGAGGAARLGVVTQANGVPLGAGSYTVQAFFGPSAALGFTVPDDPILVPSTATLGSPLTLNDVAPKLHLRKVVVNDNGGTKTVADFTLTANGAGTNDLSGVSPVDSDGTLKADTFALSETTQPGYTASAWTCVGGTQSGSNITVGLGESATCTITNNDVAPKLHLRKVVVNDNGGTKTLADFTLTANGAGTNDLSGTSPVDSGAGLKADTFVLSETTQPGYTASAWTCVGGTQSGSNITVGIGGEATCTITNNDWPEAASAQGRRQRQRWHEDAGATSL